MHGFSALDFKTLRGRIANALGQGRGDAFFAGAKGLLGGMEASGLCRVVRGASKGGRGEV